MSDSLKKGLVIDGMRMALQNSRLAPRLIFHSHRGVQCASGDYRKLLTAYRAKASMSGKGNCFDNAPMEVHRGARTVGARRDSLFRSLETEMVHRAHCPL
ncbi:MAG: hypothetical protein AAFY66_03675 [Pseudomonadota bacterium]